MVSGTGNVSTGRRRTLRTRRATDKRMAVRKMSLKAIDITAKSKDVRETSRARTAQKLAKTTAKTTAKSSMTKPSKGSAATAKSIGISKGVADGLIGAARAIEAASNASAEFAAVEARGRSNIETANRQFADSIKRGKQNALGEESKGYARGEQAVLQAVSRGQSAQGGISQSAKLAEETLGILNATTVESNAIREAYGFKEEISMIEYEIALARIEKSNRRNEALMNGLFSLTGAGTSALLGR